MSGDSFGYLYCASLLDSRADDLRAMSAAIAELPDGEIAAKRTLSLVETVEAAQRELADVWLAVEWWQSNDWSRERAAQAIAKYNRTGERTAAAATDGADHG